MDWHSQISPFKSQEEPFSSHDFKKDEGCNLGVIQIICECKMCLEIRPAMKVLRETGEAHPGNSNTEDWVSRGIYYSVPTFPTHPSPLSIISVWLGQPGAQQNIILTWFAWNLIPTSPQFKSFKNWYFMIVATANHQVSTPDQGTQAFIQTVWERIMEGVLLELRADQ